MDGQKGVQEEDEKGYFNEEIFKKWKSLQESEEEMNIFGWPKKKNKPSRLKMEIRRKKRKKMFANVIRN